MSTLTEQQRDAIAARGNVLVAAGAGTGKTSTITERCVGLVLDEKCPLDQVLMVTFTEAAAAEMRGRIRKSLRAETEKAAPGSEAADHLAEQIALLETAPISTLHSFCLDLVRRNFHALGLDPQFTVLDEQQTKPLVHAVLDALFERHYAGATASSAAVRELVRHYGNGSDDGIRQLVTKIHRHAQALAAPERWLVEQSAALSDPSPNAWRKNYIAGVAEWAQFWRDPVADFADASANAAAARTALDSLPKSGATFAQCAAALEKIAAADNTGWERGTKTKIRKPLESFFDAADLLAQIARDDAAALTQDWNWTRHHLLALLGLAREFTADFTQAKRELGGIDFADQEQLALRLLCDPTGQPTPAARACRERFRFVFVDECQDINAAQDAILRAVSREGAAANRFLVGDVKQSIYRFRLADPRIFQDYQARWSAGQETGAPAEGRVLALSENFRSRAALLNFINPLFRALMRPIIGGLDYAAAAELNFGNPAERAALALAAEDATRVELHVITKDSDGGATDDTPDAAAKPRDLIDLQTTEREARLLARRLRELKDSGHRVWSREQNGFAPVEFRDMVVLMRGVAGRAEIFAKAFHQSGVPLHAARAGFLDASEVADLLNLLRLLDNTLQDVPLLAVLRSPFVGLSADELVAVRLARRDGLLWFALNRSQKSEVRSQEHVWRKIQTFREQYRRWRELIRHSSLTHCLETALTETHYEALLLAGERGAERVANVRRLVDLARRFDPFRREGLFRFLRFIAEQEESGVRHEPAAAISENAVRLMTIHSSKGLEFPVVALAGLGAKFNTRDLSADILLDDELGLCPKVLPPESRRRYPSAAHWRAAQREKRALLGEEMRLLYVALTRAKDTLILTGTATKTDVVARWREPRTLTNYTLVKAASPLDWLQLWFARSVKPESWSGEREGASELLRWKFNDPLDASFALDSKAATTAADAAVKTPTATELSALKEILAWRYPHAATIREPAKTSVSALRRRAMEAGEEAKPMFPFQRATARCSKRVGKLNAAETGTAHHTFLQLGALERTTTELDLRNEAARLQQAGALTAAQAAALDFAALTGFWQSDLGRRLRAQPQEMIHREMPFTARMNASDLRTLNLPTANHDLANDEFVVVQGVADLVLLLPHEIWLVDFKTDDVSADNLAAKVRLYEPQLKLYALALSRIYKRPVTNCWLHFLARRHSEPVG